jgi:DNA-binding CsgD family transcriptional regulator
MQQTITEIDNLASLCSTLRLHGDSSQIASSLLEPISAVLGADSAAYRRFECREASPCLATLVSIGVPARVDDAYLSCYRQEDPAISILKRQLPAVERYRRNFLLPNGLVHHVGFLLQTPCQQHAWFLNFHRRGSSPDFDAMDFARARMVGAFLQGQTSMQATAVEKLPSARLHDLPALHALTPREREICLVLARGLANKQIATQLGISVRTVENHLANIYDKLRLGSRTQLLNLMLDQQ